MNEIITTDIIQSKIYTIRGQKVMLDRDLAELYGVETKVFNQSFKRNLERFPDDFSFQLTKNEWELLRSQIVTLKKGRGQHSKFLPFVFSQEGVAMLASILKSKKALNINIQIVRTFVAMRKNLQTKPSIKEELQDIQSHLKHHDTQHQETFAAIKYLLEQIDPKTTVIPTKIIQNPDIL